MVEATKNDLRIRPITEDDIERIIQQESKSTRYPWSHKNLLEGVRGGSGAMVVYLNEVPIGYYVVSIAAGVHEIQNIVVFNCYQGRGLGQRLLSMILTHALKDSKAEVWLEVRESNACARAIYEKAGFCVSGVRKNYYYCENDSREDAILMTLNGKITG
ncbi:MAG: ribosomal protein S18-alanine N-acetyltransferase [Acidiferrobacterales bacterium]|nr:ribosomal protein S18-alanine N-acetyltransferase [Acidiferrobacterales bacterium]